MNKPYHHGNLRNSLIEAGIELIDREGDKQLSLRKVAALCGVSQAAPYSHFQSKEGLLEAMRDYVTAQFMEALEQSICSYPKQDDSAVLVQMGKAYVTFFLRHPRYFSFLFSQSGVEVDLTLDGDASGNFPPFELMKAVAFRALGGSGLPREKMQDMIIALWATVHGLTSIATMKNIRYDKDWETKITDIIWNK